jgi:hypothetical protein
LGAKSDVIPLDRIPGGGVAGSLSKGDSIGDSLSLLEAHAKSDAALPTQAQQMEVRLLSAPVESPMHAIPTATSTPMPIKKTDSTASLNKSSSYTGLSDALGTSQHGSTAAVEDSKGLLLLEHEEDENQEDDDDDVDEEVGRGAAGKHHHRQARK